MNLAGAFRGLGVGLTQASQYQLQQQAQDRRDQVLADREQALAKLRGDQSHQDILDRARADVAVHAANVDTDTAAKKDLLPAETAAQITVNTAKEASALAAWMKKFPIEQQGKLTLAQFQASEEYKRAQMHETAEAGRTTMVQDRTDARDAANRAAHVEFQGTNDTGDLVIGHGDGGVSTVEGVKPKATVDLFGGMGGLPTPAGTAAPSSTPRPIKVTTQGGGSGDEGQSVPGGRPTLSLGPDTAFRTLYANATPEKYAGLFRNGQKVSLQEAWKLYQGTQ